MVTTQDLIKDMSGVPLGVARLMCIRQYDSRQRIDISVFQENRIAGPLDGGFLWSNTPEWDMTTSWWVSTLRHKCYGYIRSTYQADISVFPDNETLQGCE